MEEDKVMEDQPSTGAQSSAGNDEQPVESLIQGRAKRSTAGNKLSALLNAEADDELALLFEETEDDNDFSMEEEGGEQEDDMRLDSSSEEEDDQGPNAPNDDLEGEKELEKQEKEERKKRRQAADPLRLPALKKKKVNFDPTAVSTGPAPRPKKKSERISWLPTLEDGPTRSSSRRQTMQNKELTHARLKDSEEKRVRLIATMEEAAKRKALQKPKGMTQAERLAEAARVERINSKTLNRWEEMEKRKAEERRAKIEALQNRRLEGPVMSYWSGIAVWENGTLKRVGKAEITQKPEKDDTRKKSKKGDKDEKNTLEQKPAGTATGDAATAQPSTSAPAPDSLPASAAAAEGEASKQRNQTPIPENVSTPAQSNEAEAQKQPVPEKTPVPATTDQKDGNHQEPPTSQVETASASGEGEVEKEKSPATATESTQKPATTAEGEPAKQTPLDEKQSSPRRGGQPVDDSKAKEISPTSAAPEVSSPEPPAGVSPPALRAVERTPSFSIVIPPLSKELEKTKETQKDATANGEEPLKETGELPTEMEIDTPKKANDTLATDANEPSQPPEEAEKQKQSSVQPTTTEPAAQKEPEAALAPQAQAAGPAATAASNPAPQQDGTPTQLEQPLPNNEQNPSAPKVIEKTGRNLMILENFDDKTAQSKEFSIYFNAKKPPKLTKVSSSLCVITSLPSRYRDPDTSLPYANAHAYREIRRTVAQKYAWSPMLGCYVGPNGVAAQGVPERFLDPSAPAPPKVEEAAKSKEGATTEKADGGAEKGKELEKKVAVGDAAAPATPTPAPVPAAGGDAMEIDKA